ncbi:MAG: hypothetical protein EA381_14385 [Planctomycetaceae bacterium]|nr:MAG: hypothetical protein EA381_14385 [Planctomycetaceae bacterium]
MGEDELLIFLVAIALTVSFAPKTLGLFIHRLFRRDNPAAGLPPLALATSVLWIAYVLTNHADPSVTGFYTFFYLVIGMAAVIGLGFKVPQAYGLRVHVDIYQRRNLAVSLVVSGFAIATGMIYGGSVWGEADAVGDDEGGWWIPGGFFLAGWSILLLAVWVYIRGESKSLRASLVQDRDLPAARAVTVYLLGIASMITEGVAGDFWGWSEGLLGLGIIAGMILTHQLCARRVPVLMTTVESQTLGKVDLRQFEAIAYAALTVTFWLIRRTLDSWAIGVDR